MSRISTALQVGRTFGARAGMLRLGYELQRGTGLMQRRMRSAEGWPRWSLPRIAPGLSAEDFLSSRKQGKVPFFFNGAHTLQRSSKEILGSKGEENLLAEANGILVSESCHRSKGIAATGVDAHAFCLGRLR
jgi:hypothetical protein